MIKLVVGVNDFATTNPELLTEWDYEKNDLQPTEVTHGSKKKIWWRCKKYQHSYQMILGNKTGHKYGCPVCAGKQIQKGYNDLATTNPEIIKEWDFDKNEIKPTEISSGSNKKVWWRCQKYNHSWEGIIATKIRLGTGCPICSGHRILSGFNDLATTNPELLSEWDYEKNDLKPNEVSGGSNKKVWWCCKAYGHSWQAVIASRNSGCGCPICSGFQVLEGFNDLATVHPELLEEWDYAKNIDILPNQVHVGSPKKVWWLCKKCGRSWSAEIRHRSQKGVGCAVCSGKACGTGVNDLATVFPEIAEEFDAEKNSIPACEIAAFSGLKCWWKCKVCGRSWQASVNSRTGSNQTGCPHCDKENKTSFPEQTVFFYIKQYFPDAINSYKLNERRLELDVYIPSLNIGIEYDGQAWHSDTKKDEIKNTVCRDMGITLIRIRERGLPVLQTGCITYNLSYEKLTDTKELERVLIDLLTEHLGIPNDKVDINTHRDNSAIHTQYRSKKQTNSLLSKFPEIAAEWHPQKNGDLTPANVPYGSRIKVWWKCKDCGYEWETLIYQRAKTKDSTGCPKCRKKQAHEKYMAQILEKTDLLKDSFPELLKEWNYTRNGNITPDKIAARSSQKVWWKCSDCGHEWQAIISNRTRKGSGCPICANAERIKKGIGTRKVICIETQITYNRIADIERELGINHACIIACCKGKNKTAGGYHWKYADG